MADQTETISPVDYAYRIRSKCRKALAQAKEAGAPKDLITHLAAAMRVAERYVETFVEEDEVPENPVPKAPPVAKPPTVRKAADPARLALIEEINALKREQASLKRQIPLTPKEDIAA